MWAPLRLPADTPDARRHRELRRLRVLVDAYGLDAEGRARLVDAVLGHHDWMYGLVRDGARQRGARLRRLLDPGRRRRGPNGPGSGWSATHPRCTTRCAEHSLRARSSRVLSGGWSRPEVATAAPAPGRAALQLDHGLRRRALRCRPRAREHRVHADDHEAIRTAAAASDSPSRGSSRRRCGRAGPGGDGRAGRVGHQLGGRAAAQQRGHLGGRRALSGSSAVIATSSRAGRRAGPGEAGGRYSRRWPTPPPIPGYSRRPVSASSSTRPSA